MVGNARHLPRPCFDEVATVVGKTIRIGAAYRSQLW
jgi:hypothetical protein